MSFDFDDHLKANKRKNTNPARLTNLLIVAGFMVLAILMIVFMNHETSPESESFSEVEVRATVNASLIQAKTREAQPTLMPAPTWTIEHRPVIEGTQLISDTTTVGTITDEAFAIDYAYDGKAGMPIVVTMRGDTLTSPALVLTHPNGERMVSSIASEQIINSESIQVIAVILPTDGQYIITATRKGGRAGDAQGDFTLTVDIPKSLDTNSTITSTVTNNSWDWYLIESEEPFTIVYQHVSGAFKPELTVYTLNRRMELIEQGYLPDGQLTYGVIGYFAADTVHFVAAGQPTHRRYDSAANTIGSYKIGIRLAQ